MKRTLVVLIALFVLVGVARADDLEDSYSKLKDAVEKKDADAVKTESAATLKLANEVKEADRLDYAKDVVAYTEYALASTATQVPDKAVELVEALIAQNPKSKYLDTCTPAYLAALGKSGAAKQLAGMTKIVAGRPDNEVALAALTEGLANSNGDRAVGYANRLVAVLSKKPKPEGVSEADWERTKTAGLATGYYIAGAIYGGKNAWVDCDRDMKAALPFVHDNTRLSVIYFYLGLANYQLGKVTMDKPRIQTGLKYSQQSAAIAGPMKDQASRNVIAIQNELQGRK
jgi:hypothetical protein